MMAHHSNMTLQHHEAELAIQSHPAGAPIVVPPGTNLKACRGPVPVPSIHVINCSVSGTTLVSGREYYGIICTGAGRGSVEGNVVDPSAGFIDRVALAARGG